MTARSFLPHPLRGRRLVVFAGLVLAILCAVAASTQAATAVSSVSLCVKKGGPGKGTIRLRSRKTHCDASERAIVLVANPGSKGGPGTEGATGQPGEKGPI